MNKTLKRLFISILSFFFASIGLTFLLTFSLFVFSSSLLKYFLYFMDVWSIIMFLIVLKEIKKLVK